MRIKDIMCAEKSVEKYENFPSVKATSYKLKPTSSSGFTLVEMVVAVGLFAVVMLISVSSLLALIDANRKARTLQSVVNNLNVALDGMVRAIRMGRTYHCGTEYPANGPASCPGGHTRLAFIGHDGAVIEYALDAKRIQIIRNGGAPAYLTSPEVEITELNFYAVGTDPTDSLQPKVVMVVQGLANPGKQRVQSAFSIQSTAVQRVLDLP